MNQHALKVLEYPQALALVARHASSELGAAAVRALEPSVDRGWIEAELSRVAEMMRVLGEDGGWGMPAVPGVREALPRLRLEGSVLEGPALRGIEVLLTSSSSIRRVFVRRGEALPLLAALAERLVELPKLAEAIAQAIDEKGEIRDTASPELVRLRRELRGIRARLIEKLEAFAGSLQHHHRVSDASVTIRDGRYVIPVRREARSEVGGIVHGESATGATLFIEPPVAIEIMNRLRELEAAEAREVLRILRELTERLRPHVSELRDSLELLVELDSIYARARYAVRADGSVPTLLDAGTEEYGVVQGRHPLLQATLEAVIPFDLRMERGEHTLLISGPNTGGKTVLLKAMGLLSLMTQSGIVPPVGEGTRLPIFRDIFADIGDEQSIEASLSTFSAHLKNLRELLDGADIETLALIDEIGSGTDPLEGGALARAVLLELTRRSALTVATTHYGQLKLLATEEPGIVNASLQFDAERLQPTYRLLKGVPGQSYGLAIARRLGLPEPILSEAEESLPQGERDVAKLLLELEAKEQRLADASVQLERQLAETGSLRERLEAQEVDLRRREKDAERRARQQARDLLLAARQEVEVAIREVRDAAEMNAVDAAAKAARRRVEEAAKRQKERAPDQKQAAAPGEQGAAQALEVGLRVRIESLGKTGTVVDVRDGKAMVEAGSMRLLLPSSDLSVLPPGDQNPQGQNRAAPRRALQGGAVGYVAAEMEATSEIDLRGLRVDEMEFRLGRALDAAIMSGLPSFRIIHGKGTGALRDRVEELLRGDRRVVSYRPGERYEGGTGVTVAEFG
jgi:DNA mismatch repair protein MutS2